MTEKLYDNDSFLKKFSAVVLSCEKTENGFAVILDKTAFFPEAGGQKSDRGFIDGVRVFDVKTEDETIIHYTEKELECGKNVNCEIDFVRRFDFMQQHSGEHIVSGVAHSLFGCENVGFHLSENIVTLDFDKNLSSDDLNLLEQRVNEKIYDNVKFITYYPDDETLKTLNYRSKKELSEKIRIVEIEDTDMCACCAPHVKTSGQVGLVKFLAVEKIRGGTRIEIACGKRAFDSFCKTYKTVSHISNLLCVKTNECAAGVDRLFKENSDLRYKLSGFNKQILENIALEYQPKCDSTAEFFDNFDMKEIQMLSDMLYKKHGGIRGVFSAKDGGFSFAVCSDEEKLSVFFKQFKEKFSVRGGGRNGMVQGSLTAQKNEITEFFEKYL